MTNGYPHIIQRLTSDDWAITAEAYQSLWAALDVHSAGLPRYTAEEVALSAKERREKMGPLKVGKGVAVMDIAGIIGKRMSTLESMCGGVSVDSIVQTAEQLTADKDIGTVVMNWHSPGGVVTGVPEAYAALVDMAKEKTFISYTDTRMCSAAQWLASAASSVYAAATADTASVGVYNMVVDRSRQLANDGVQVNAIHAGKFKLMGAPFKEMSAEERDMIQARVDDIHAQFKVAVGRDRPNLDQAALEGQVLTGKAAKAAGLIDGIYPSLRSLLSAIVDRKA